MAKAVWNGHTLAESDTYEVVEGNVYFPEETVKREFLQAEFDDLKLPMEGPGALLHPRWSTGRRIPTRPGTTRIPSRLPGM